MVAKAGDGEGFHLFALDDFEVSDPLVSQTRRIETYDKQDLPRRIGIYQNPSGNRDQISRKKPACVVIQVGRFY